MRTSKFSLFFGVVIITGTITLGYYFKGDSIVKQLGIVILALLLCSCQGGRQGNVLDNVLGDFGLKERPEGYVSGADKVMQNLEGVGRSEMRRMNIANRQGEILYQTNSEGEGRYYKKVKVYGNYYAQRARAVTRSNDDDRGYVGFIEYSYRVYESARKRNRTMAAAEEASIATDKTGRETYRYNFSSSGNWRGGKGELTKK